MTDEHEDKFNRFSLIWKLMTILISNFDRTNQEKYYDNLKILAERVKDKEDHRGKIAKFFTELVCLSCIENSEKYIKSFKAILNLAFTENGDYDKDLFNITIFLSNIAQNYNDTIKSVNIAREKLIEKKKEQEKAHIFYLHTKKELTLLTKDENTQKLIEDEVIKKHKVLEKSEKSHQQVIQDIMLFIDSMNRRQSINKS